jgi:hypothetical protein
MTITQTVDIPADRRLHLDFELPPEFPAGKTVITFRPVETAALPIGTEKVMLSEKEKAREREYIKLHAEELNKEMEDVLSYHVALFTDEPEVL